MKFHNFGNYLPSETDSPFIWTNNLCPLHPSNCSKFDWNWLSILEKKFFKFVNLFLLFFFFKCRQWNLTILQLPPFGKISPSINNLSPLHTRMNFIKFGWNGLRDSIKEAILLLSPINPIPLGKSRCHLFWQFRIPLTQKEFLQGVV